MKYKSMILVLAAFAMIAAGCSSSEAPAAPVGIAAPAATEAPTGETLGLGNTGIPGLFGEIKDIAGNEVTLLLLEIQSEAEAGTGMRRGNGGADVVREYTGEEKTILIPVGTPMVKRVPQSGTGETGTGTGTGPVETEVSLKELSKGSTLKIFYYENTTNIEKIIVQPPRN
ncbi:hypothetical protein [Youngiibacter multivorans]|uniref:Copper chaperone PCu(A)C n=1 Tax=Youngiibacter multivorans TaxID=937251 RepID=A0ABS4G087_9CLOT|nr:hypothetical protein [Youngiibacter multivorans]MBP1917963.1 hypothetical protein [Youngiibacter multivorans]